MLLSAVYIYFYCIVNIIYDIKLPMQISMDCIEKIANLAMLALSKTELETYKKDLENILNYVKVLESVDTSKVEPIRCVIPIELNERVDEVHEKIGESSLRNSAGFENNLIKVPKII